MRVAEAHQIAGRVARGAARGGREKDLADNVKIEPMRWREIAGPLLGAFKDGRAA
jgi:hypothetical protein